VELQSSPEAEPPWLPEEAVLWLSPEEAVLQSLPEEEPPSSPEAVPPWWPEVELRLLWLSLTK
jgi:hypothetical protein